MNFLAGAPGIEQLTKFNLTNTYSANPVSDALTVAGDFNVGTVAVGDICILMAQVQLTQGTPNGGQMLAQVSNATGTATVVWGTSSVATTWETGVAAANESQRLPWTTVGVCTVAGTWIPRALCQFGPNGGSFSMLARFLALRGD